MDSVAPVPSCTFDTNTFSRTALITEAAAVDSAATVTKSYRYPARDPASNTKLGTLTPIKFLRVRVEKGDVRGDVAFDGLSGPEKARSKSRARVPHGSCEQNTASF